ncbi:MAG: glycosyltransferase, partial [Rubricoccaceae bacterium]|nr:glycosyltransferase [Rubricoccaceae bacterium]
MTRFCLIGPTYPFRGGIAHYTTLLAEQLKRQHETLLISFTRQYPRWLFPGRSDRDPSEQPLRTDADYLLDPINPLSWRRTLRRIRRWRPDIVVIPWWVPFWAPAWAYLGRGIKRLDRRPHLLFICHNVTPHEKGRFDTLALHMALAAGDAYVVHSKADAKRLRAHFPGADIRTTPHSTYAAFSRVKQSTLTFSLPSDRPLLLFCGFIRPYKGLDILLEALPSVLARIPVHLLIAGESWGESDLYTELINDLGLDGDITFEDRYLRNEELAACLDLASVVVLPYRSASQSGVIQLALGVGRPVITTDVGGLSEAVEHERTGLVVPPEDSQALAEAIVRFFDQKLGPVFEDNIKSDAARFDWERLVEKLHFSN